MKGDPEYEMEKFEMKSRKRMEGGQGTDKLTLFLLVLGFASFIGIFGFVLLT